MLRHQGITAIAAIILIFVVLHWSFVPEHHDQRITGTVMLGGIAFLLMTASVVLATRLAIFEGLFGGLDRMYQVHRFAGTFTAVFALLHFFGIPKVLPEGADPATNSVFPSLFLGMGAMILLVLGLFIALNRKISYSRWRNPHKIMALVYVLTIGHFMEAPGALFERFTPSGYVLIAAAIIGVVALIYTLLGMNKHRALPFTIEAVNPMERATEIVLKPLGKMLSFNPGQFAFIEIQGKGWSEPHPFTMSSAPSEDRLRFTIKVLGDWTRKVREELKPGGEVLVRGPHGRFDSAKATNKKQVWFAGGIGLTPFLSKIRAMEVGDDREIHLVYAARNKDEAIFSEELNERASQLNCLSVYQLFSDDGEFVRVEIAKSKLTQPLASYEYFICGPKPMVDGIRKDLEKEGVKRAQIHTEAFEFR